MTENLQRPSIAACVTLFHPDESVDKLLTALRETYDDLILIDNGGGSGLIEPGDVVVRKPDGNVGVSWALNLGVGEARDRGYQWVAYFDQDSWPHYRSAELAARLSQAAAGTAIVSAQYVDRATGRSGYRDRRLHGYPLAPISSGSAFRVAAWEAVGGFETRLPVDLVDTEYALRVQQAGYSIELETGLELDHSVGAKTDYRILGRQLTPAGHVPWRLYTKLDASVVVLPRYLRTFPNWSARHIKERVLETGVEIVLGSQRRDILRMIGRWILRRTPAPIRRINATSAGLKPGG
ncbi:MAG: hypothetical protein ACN4GZ_10900 [Acidimicrobiales bacterium]